MAAARRVGVRELVDQHDLRPAGDDRIEVHLLQPLAPVFDALARNDFEALRAGLGLLAGRASRPRRRRCRSRLSCGRGPSPASHRSCRRPAPRRRKSAACRGGSPPAGRPQAGPPAKAAVAIEVFRHSSASMLLGAARARMRRSPAVANGRSPSSRRRDWSSARLSSSTLTSRSGVRNAPGAKAPAPNQRLDLRLGKPAGRGHARRLIERRMLGDVGVQAAARRCRQFRRQRIVGRGAVGGDDLVRPVGQIGARRRLVAAAGAGAIVVDRRRARPEVARLRELLRDQPAADDRSVRGGDQRTLCGRRRQSLGRSPQITAA